MRKRIYISVALVAVVLSTLVLWRWSRFIGDTEEELLADPVNRTHFVLGALRHRTLKYSREHGRIPPRLEDLTRTVREPVARRLVRDGWGNRIRYAATGGRFEFRSPGPDRRAYTPDDIVLRDSLGPAR